MKGYVQVYTGDGKGKTTASLGLALRAAGAGLKVYIVQFLKKGDYSEIKALEKFDNITAEQFGLVHFIKGKPSDEDMEVAKKGYLRLREVLEQNEHDVVIAEEANIAFICGLITEAELLSLIDIRPDNVELVFTGRGAPYALMAKADLITEMKEIKHYFQKGVQARIGIEK